jgi:LacI family transcriptional regulator
MAGEAPCRLVHVSGSPMNKRVTLKDVAQAVGVHVSTVSRALDPKTRHLITPEIATQILKTSRELDYRPNAAAYSLKTNRTRTVGVVLPDITNPIFPPIIRGIEDALEARNYVAILANTDGKPGREAGIAETLQSRGVDGLILASAEWRDAAAEKLFSRGAPIITVNRRVEDPRISSVVHDEDEGMRRVLEHLAGLGHVRIANIAGPQALSTGRDRYEAFERHRARTGLDEAPIVFAHSFDEAEGERCARDLLSSARPFTAVVCSNDRLAIGAIAALRGAGLSCPDRVSVTGYNDMPLVDRLSPPLTTVRIQQYKVGFKAAQLLVEMVELPPEERSQSHIVMPVELIVRGSTAAVAAR